MRQFIKGTDGPWVSNFASVLCGSPNIYLHDPGEHDWWGQHGGRRWKGGRGPTASINFVTAHDGFTLGDVVAYNEKHNEANGEDNRWGVGALGPGRRDRGLGCLCDLAGWWRKAPGWPGAAALPATIHPRLEPLANTVVAAHSAAWYPALPCGRPGMGRATTLAGTAGRRAPPPTPWWRACASARCATS